MELLLDVQHQWRPRRILSNAKWRNQLVDRELHRRNRAKAKGLSPPDQSLIGHHFDEQRVRSGQVAVAPSGRVGFVSL
jgi:hypothetical protein